MPKPRIVTLTAPDPAGEFEPLRAALLTTNDACENARLALADTIAKDATNPTCDSTPEPTLPASDESDCHTVASTPLPPKPLAALDAEKTVPNSVTLTAPVAGPFDTSALLTSTLTSSMIAAPKLPVANATVTVTPRVSTPPAPDLHCTALADSHNVESDPLAPTRAPPLGFSTPRPLPSTVTLDAPVNSALIGDALNTMGVLECVNASDSVPSTALALTDTPN
jgi:hypothetical protein